MQTTMKMSDLVYKYGLKQIEIEALREMVSALESRLAEAAKQPVAGDAPVTLPFPPPHEPKPA